MSASDRAGLLALLAGLPPSTRGELVRMYRRSIASHLAVILAPGATGEPLLAALRGLAGSAAMMQDLPLSQAARGMEAELRAGRIDQGAALRPGIEAGARRTLAVLDSLDGAA